MWGIWTIFLTGCLARICLCTQKSNVLTLCTKSVKKPRGHWWARSLPVLTEREFLVFVGKERQLCTEWSSFRGQPNAHFSILWKASFPNSVVCLYLSFTSGTRKFPTLETFFKKFYLFIFRERGREGEGEGEKHQCVVASHQPPTRDLAHNPACAPGNQTDPFDWQLVLHPLSYTSQGRSFFLF